MTMSAAILKPPSLLRRLPWRTIAAITFLLALSLFLARGTIADGWELHQALDLMEERQFSAAQPMLLHFLEGHPDNVAVNRALALGYLHGTRQLAETRKYLDRWGDLQPRAAEAFKERMGFWMMQEMVDPAIRDAQHVLELNPGD